MSRALLLPLIAGACLLVGCRGGAAPPSAVVSLGPSRVVYLRPPSGCPAGSSEKGERLCAVCDLSEGDTDCSQKCGAGDGDACANLAFAYGFGALGRTPNASVARNFAEQGCAKGSADACEAVAGCYNSGIGCVKDRQRAFRMWWNLCEMGKGSACSSVSFMYFDAGDAVRGFAFAERGCRSGDPAGCARLAERCAAYRPEDGACRRKALAEACRLGDDDSCDATRLPAR
jgi:TPR repeat protein